MMQSKLQQNSNIYLWRDLFFLAVFSAIYFLIFLGSRHLSIPDEGRYPEIAREMLTSGNWTTPTINGVPFLDKPILYYWFEAASMKFFGVNAWAIRLPQCIFGIVGVLLVYVFSRRLYNRRVGILAALILATSPIYFMAAHYANMDLEVANFLWVSILLFLVGLQYSYPSRYRRWFMWAAYVVAGFAFSTKGLMGFVFPGMVIFLWMLFLNRWRLLKEMYLISGVIIFLIVTLPWLIAAQIQNPDFFHFFFYYQQFDRYVSTGFNNRFGPWFYFAIVLLGMLPWSFMLLGNVRNGISVFGKNRHTDSNTFFIALWVVAIFIFFSIPASKIVGYILPIIAPLALLMAKSLDGLLKNISAKGEKGITKSFKVSYCVTCLVLLGCGIALLIFPITQNKINLSILYQYFIPAGIALIAGAIISFLYMRKLQIIKAIATIIICMVIFNIFALLSIPLFDLKGSQPLTDKIKPMLTKNSIIVSYRDYWEDLPLLLERHVYIVDDWHNKSSFTADNWSREFYNGIIQYKQANQNMWPKWYIDQIEFQKLWQKDKSIFVFTDKGKYKYLENQLIPKPHFIAQYRDVIVFKK